MREGSATVTPVIQLTKELGPGSIVWGSDEELGAYLNDRHAAWRTMRDDLMKYANQHPSERVRELAHEVEHGVWLTLRKFAYVGLR